MSARSYSRGGTSELPPLSPGGLDLPRRHFRDRPQPALHPLGRLPLGHAVSDLRPAARGRLPQRRHGSDLQGRQTRHESGRPGGAGAHPHRHRRQRDDCRPAPGAGDPRQAARRHDGSRRATPDAGLMDALVPLPVAVPLLAAAVLSALGHFMPRRLDDLIGIGVAASSMVISLLLLFHATRHHLVYWFGGWKPRDGVAIGISFTVDPFGAATAALIATLVTAALVFSWRYFDEVGTLFHVLMLVFLAGMTGFALSGDLFNMFVWFELMGVAAYGLTGYRIEEASPLQGAINFAVTNTVGAYCVLIGIALFYGRTGALNLAQMGNALAGHKPDGLVVVAFGLVAAGFLVKGAAVPFHFWLADAHAVAPTPVCVLFSGAMVELGLYGVARVYWTVFSGVPGAHDGGLRDILIGLGLLSAVLGAVMCFLQRHVKRMLAYSTISHAGLILMGIGLLTPKALG